MSNPDLTLEKNECTSLWNDMPPELSEQEIDHVNVALINLWMVRFEMAFGGLGTSLSRAEDVGEKFHYDGLSWRYNILGSGTSSVEFYQFMQWTYSDSLKA
jgi:hypothetical protein